MERFLFALLVTIFVSGPGQAASADDKQSAAVLDKAMNALGGEDKLSKIKAVTWNAKGKITFGETGKFALADREEHDFTSRTTARGLEHFRSEIDIHVLNILDELKRDGIRKDDFDKELKELGAEVEELGKLRILTVLNGDKAWFTAMDYPGKRDAGKMKRTVYLEVIPVMLAPLKGPGFKVETAGAEKVRDRPVVILKVTCPDGNEIRISFDRESGLPVRAVGKVFTLEEEEITQETTYSDYKDFGGIKVATQIELKNGWLNRKLEVTEFKILDAADPSTFKAPKYVDDLK
jgi:hypothetical protein